MRKYMVFFLAALAILFVIIYRAKFKKVLIPFLLASIIAYILMPAVNWLAQKKKFSRLKAVIIVYGVIILIFSLIVYYIIPLILDEISQISVLLPYYFKLMTEIEKIIQKRYSDYLPPQLEAAIIDNMGKVNKQISVAIGNGIKSIILIMGQSLNLILSPIIAFYILKDSQYLYKHFLMLFPGKYRQTIDSLLKEIDKVIKGFVNGQLLVALFVAVVTSIGLYAIGLNFAILIGLIAGIFNIVPYIGPIISGGLAVMAGLVQSPYKALSAVIIFLIVHQIESGILSPKIVGESVGLHPIIVIFSLLLGEEFFGVWGMFFSIPVVAAAKVILNYIIDNMDMV